MDKKFQIVEIARFFDMPASTFRYWEDKGILHPRKKIENQYRDRAVRFRLEVEEENHAAVRLYRRKGYTSLPYAQMVKELPK